MKRISSRAKNPQIHQIKPLYTRCQAIYMAFYSSKLYVDVVRRWPGFGLLYVLLLFSILVLPYGVQAIIKSNKIVNEYIISPVERLPAFSVYQGRVHYSGEMPYLAKNDNGEVVAILDTQGHIKQLPNLKYPKASLLITEKHIFFNMRSLDWATQHDISKQAVDVTPIKKFGDNFHLYGADLIDQLHVKALTKALSFSIYPCLIVFYTIMYIFLLFPMAFIGQLISRYFFKFELSFKQSARLMFVAITPQAFIFCSLLALDDLTLTLRIISPVMLTAYFCFGVTACKRERKYLATSAE